MINVTKEDVEHQLDRIFAHPLFHQSANLQNLLTHLVYQRLAGVENLWEYKGDFLSAEVFDKSSSIGKVTATQCRNRLEQYYAGDGAADPIRIIIPLGGFRPEIVKTHPSAATLHAALKLLEEAAKQIPEIQRFIDELASFTNAYKA